MAAPSPTTRQAPSGIMLRNGFRALITFARNPDLCVWEIEVTPPGVSGGDAINTTTQHNTEWMTKAARALKELTDGKVRCAYDPKYGEISDIINSEDTITVRWPDGSTAAAFGYASDWKPDGMSHGNLPTGDLTLVFTNWDPANDVEAGPVFTPVTGT